MQCGDNVLATRYTVQFQMVKTSTKENSPHKEIECVEECGGGGCRVSDTVFKDSIHVLS